MKTLNYRNIAFLVTAVIASWMGTAQAAEWTGGSAAWSSTGTPGWGGAFPNGASTMANNNITETGTVTQDVPGLTIGTLSLSGSGDFTWTHDLISNPIIFDQDGAGAGFATISNSNTFAGENNSLLLTGGSITLADDLLITNSGGSLANSGAVQIGSIIGGSGDVTFRNEVVSTATGQNFDGFLRLLSTGVNTFTGNVLIQKGITHFSNNNSFGDSSNVVTIGDTGLGSASLLIQTGGVNNFSNPIVVAAGSGGDLYLGSTTTAAPIYTGTITLNANLNISSHSTSTNGMGITGIISGTGSLTMPANQVTGDPNGRVRITGNNDYSGGTTIIGGTVLLGSSSTETGGPLGTGLVTLMGGTLNATVTGGVTLNNEIKINGTATLDTVASGTPDILTLTGALTSTNSSDVINLGTNNGTVNIFGDISGYHGTFNINASGGNNLILDGLTPENSDGSNAKFVLTGPSSGSARILRFGNNNNDTVKLGSLSGSGQINPVANAPIPDFVTEIGHLNMDDEFSGSTISGASTVMNVRKVGTGSLTLSGTNAYRGTTTVSSGTLIAGADAISTLLSPVVLSDADISAANDEFTLVGHGLVNGDRVTFTSTRPGGIASVTFYHVVESTADTFKVSTSAGGGAVDITGTPVSATIHQAGAFGSGNSAIVLGDAGTGSNNIAVYAGNVNNPGSTITIERDINVTSNGTGIVSIGGHTADNATFSGDISLSRDIKLESAAAFGNQVTVSGVISGNGGITKVGSGLAVLSAENEYTGDTVVQEGTLFLENPSLANSSAVYLTNGSLLQLNFDTLTTTDAIDALFINGNQQANGKWGGIGSIAIAGADFESDLISGTGLLLVTPGTVPGDYNGDDVVNAADYVVWRDNHNAVGGGNPAGYNQWKANFGTGSGSGSASAQGQGAVPEPSSFVMMLGAVLLACFGRRYVRS